MNNTREIHVLSGHMGGGKSRCFKILSEMPKYKASGVFMASKDSMYVRHYGWRVQGELEDTSESHLKIFNTMTASERSYTDELLRVDMERALVTDQARIALLDVGMRSRKSHQEPFMATVEKIEGLLERIDQERGIKRFDDAPKLNLRVILFFASFEVVVHRLWKRWPALRGTLPRPFVESTSGHEIPEVYPFLAVNTNDESEGAEEARMEEIQRYLAGEEFDRAFLQNRAQAARESLVTMQRHISRGTIPR